MGINSCALNGNQFLGYVNSLTMILSIQNVSTTKPRKLVFKEYCLQGNIHPVLFRLFRPRCLRATLILDEFQSLKSYLVKHNYVWANSRRDETVLKRRGANNTRRK